MQDSVAPVLTDNFGRAFEYLRLSVTDVCNFHCNYCLPDGYEKNGQNRFLSLPEIETLVSAFARLGTKKVRITGGEPCLRKDIVDIVRLCKKIDGIETVAMTTNGYNLVDKVADLKAAGLDAINISMDSPDPRIFSSITGYSKYQRVLDGLKAAQACDFDAIKINAVLLKEHNASAVNQFKLWLKEQPLSIRFIELMQTGNNRAFFEKNHLSGQRIKQALLDEGWQPVIRHKLAGPAEEFFHPDYRGKFGLIMPYSKDFCTTCNRLRVSATGKLHLCLFAEAGIDLREYLVEANVKACVSALQSAIQAKAATHGLHESNTGATTHLAMLGG